MIIGFIAGFHSVYNDINMDPYKDSKKSWQKLRNMTYKKEKTEDLLNFRIQNSSISMLNCL